MVVSEARIEANKRNAALSTGPKTPEGKAVSRANSFKHGLTGGGIVASETETSLIGEIAGNLRDRYKPATTDGLALLDRAAVHLVRLGRFGRVEQAIVDDSVLTAVAEFDQFRIDYADDVFNSLESNPDAIDELQTFPEGIDRLIAEWESLSWVEEWTPENLARLGRISEAGRCTPNVIRSMIPGEIARLEDIKASIDRRPIEVARKRAADIALFPTSREAILFRRYEAATERAYHKAMKTFHEVEATAKAPAPSPEVSQIDAVVAEMGSFSPEPSPPPEPEPQDEAPASVAAPVAPNPPVDRKKRPDPQKLREAMKRKRR